MSNTITLASLPPERRRLLKRMRQINFGRIENLVIKDGQPVLSPLPHVVREVKSGGENGPRREASLEDFVIKDEIIELFRYMDEVQDAA